MLTKEAAAAIAYLAIADLVWRDYFRSNFDDVCHSYPSDKSDDVEYEYFMKFERITETIYGRYLRELR